MHWFTHKKHCKQLAKQYQREQEMEKELARQQKEAEAAAEEEAKKEAEKNEGETQGSMMFASKLCFRYGLSYTTPEWVQFGLLFTSHRCFSYTTFRQSKVLRWAYPE